MSMPYSRRLNVIDVGHFTLVHCKRAQFFVLEKFFQDHCTLSFVWTFASNTTKTFRLFHRMRFRSAIGPLTSIRSLLGPVVFPILPRQFQTPEIPIGMNRGDSFS